MTDDGVHLTVVFIAKNRFYMTVFKVKFKRIHVIKIFVFYFKEMHRYLLSKLKPFKTVENIARLYQEVIKMLKIPDLK